MERLLLLPAGEVGEFSRSVRGEGGVTSRHILVQRCVFVFDLRGGVGRVSAGRVGVGGSGGQARGGGLVGSVGHVGVEEVEVDVAV